MIKAIRILMYGIISVILINSGIGTMNWQFWGIMISAGILDVISFFDKED